MASCALRRQARIARSIFCWVNSSPQMPFASCPRFPVAVGRCCCVVTRALLVSQFDSGKVSKLTLATQRRLPSMSVVVAAVTQWQDRVKHKGKDMQGESENPEPTRPRRRGLDGGWYAKRRCSVHGEETSPGASIRTWKLVKSWPSWRLHFLGRGAKRRDCTAALFIILPKVA